MIRIEYLNTEEIRQMLRHKWIESEKQNHNIGEVAFLDWIEKYADSFSTWAKTIPEKCINCRLHPINHFSECVQPFDEHRLSYIYDHNLNKTMSF